MLRGLRGEKRPADVIGAAVMVARIATDEIKEQIKPKNESAAAELGSKGGKARAAGPPRTGPVDDYGAMRARRCARS